MEWAKSKSVDEIGARGEKLREKKLQGYGNKTVIDGKVESIGAGGWGGGVHLAMSDEDTREKNRVMLEAMFKRERKRRRRELGRGNKSDSEDDQEEKKTKNNH